MLFYICISFLFASIFKMFTSPPPPSEHPLPPTLRRSITTTPSTVTLEVDHRNTCFENCTFQYEVKVHPAGNNPTTTHSTNVFNVSGLSGGTRYRAEIVAVCVEESTIRSDPLNVNFTTRMEGVLSVFVVVSQLQLSVVYIIFRWYNSDSYYTS